MNKNRKMILTAIIAVLGILTANCAALENNAYTDVIMSVYINNPNLTVIETSNWQYVVLDQYIENLGDYLGCEIIIKDLEEIGENKVISTILIDPTIRTADLRL